MTAAHGMIADVRQLFRFLFDPRYPRFLLIVFVIYAALWAIQPYSYANWLLENVLTFIAVGFLVWCYRRLPLSNVSYTLIFLFLCLHTIGAHYTYSRVPLDEWSQAAFGTSVRELLGWQRKNFDRVVHFCFGLMISYPVREVFTRVARARGFWSYYLPLDVTISLSAVYELISRFYKLAFPYKDVLPSRNVVLFGFADIRSYNNPSLSFRIFSKG